MKYSHKNTLIISAKKGYFPTGFIKSGYNYMNPYRDKTLVSRVMREIWFRLGLPEQMWYVNIAADQEPLKIVVYDPQITVKYIFWLQKRFPNAEIRYKYNNLIGTIKHLHPHQIPEGVIIQTYDRGDSEKYNIELSQNGDYFPCFIGKKKPWEERMLDVFFVGKDKGRAEALLSLQKEIESLGLKTRFIITADGRLSPRKKFYSKEIPYEQVIMYDTDSRALLNMVMPGQIGATMRDYEAIYNEVKLITTNTHIKEYDFYKGENVFILGERNLAELPEFLKTPFVPVEQYILDKHLLK